MSKTRAVKHPGPGLLGIVGLLSVVLALVGCGGEDASDTPEISAAPGQGGHRLQVVVLDDIKAIIAESAAEDKVLVIDFWATWCVPCVEMFPSIHEGLVARGEGVRAVSVTLDDPSREADAVAFLRDHDALHDAYIFESDSEAQQALADGIGEKWNSLAVPAILVYDSGGKLVGEFLEGGSTDAILDQVDVLLASGQGK